MADKQLCSRSRKKNGFRIHWLTPFSLFPFSFSRKFHLAYSERGEVAPEIQYPPGTKSKEGQIQYPLGTEFQKGRPVGDELVKNAILHPLGAESVQGFSSQLSWSHYRVLMRVENEQARAERRDMTRGQCGSLHLHCKTLSFSTFCRY